jgi:hypothetical protein
MRKVFHANLFSELIFFNCIFFSVFAQAYTVEWLSPTSDNASDYQSNVIAGIFGCFSELAKQ